MKKITLPIIEVGKILHHKKINDQVIKNKKTLDKFFQIDLSIPQVILFCRRKDINKYYGRKTKAWIVGWSKGRAIYLLHPDHYLKESSHTDPKRYWKILLHEHAHQYINFLTNGVTPRWLNEGLASYLANQRHAVPTESMAFRVFDPLTMKDGDVYMIGYFWVKLLIDKFGRNKLLQLFKELKSASRQPKFGSVFYKIYKIKFSKKDFLVLYKS